MELSYWQSRWNKGKTGFHMEGGYPGLQKHWKNFPMQKLPEVLVPLCGKSEDLVFLSEKSAAVTGVEISEKAADEFFSDLKLSPVITHSHGFKIYSAGNISIWCGDFFRFPLLKERNYDLIYDKGGLVALPEKMRIRYSKKIHEISGSSNNTVYLLHHFEYNQPEMPGPPFSVTLDEIKSLFGNRFILSVLEENELNIEQFEKFRRRGLNSYFRERFLLLLS